MPEYIDREAVIKTAKDGNHSDFGRSMADLTSLREVLEDTPAADVVEVKHGRWVEEGCGLLVCSKCNFEYDHSGVPFEGLYYCPNCGARMDGERKDGDGNGL